VRVCVYASVRVRVFVCACVRVCMCVCVRAHHMHAYTRIYSQTNHTYAHTPLQSDLFGLLQFLLDFGDFVGRGGVLILLQRSF